MFCTNCGHELPTEGQFCPYCGIALNKNRGYFCSNCGSKLEKEHVFCSICGVRIESSPSAEQTKAFTETEFNNEMYVKSVVINNQILTVEDDEYDYTECAPKEEEEDDEFTRIVEADEGFQAALKKSEQKNIEKLTCPICGSANCTPVVETSSSGSDFSAEKGCCGFVLLGPIGLLCGACGEGKQTSSTTYWMCNNCGNKFQK